jgi:protein-disulfide isomerase
VAAGPVVRQLLHDFTGQIRLVMKHVPSESENAMLAAEAALAAWEQGKYWEMHDQLIENSPRFGREELSRYAGAIGLDMARFTEALDAMRHSETIARDKQLGEKLGLFATPTFIVNGRMVVGAPPYPAFKGIVEEELARSGNRERE